MNNNFWANLGHTWYILLIAFIFGIVVTTYLPKKLRHYLRVFTNRILLVKSYWIFVIIFVVLSTIGYRFVFSISPTDSAKLHLDAYNEILTLTFAIFVGYFAFKQAKESRFDKLKDNANLFLSSFNPIDNPIDYEKAIIKYEECLRIISEDFDCWSNLMELYLIVKRFNVFDNKLDTFKSVLKTKHDWLTYYYLLAARQLLNQHIDESKEAIATLINFTTNNPSALAAYGWSFKEVTSSDQYIKLEADSKKLFDNLIKYLSRQLSAEDKVRFEAKEYELNPIQPQPAS